MILTHIRIAGNKKLIGTKLCGAIKIDGIGRLVRAQRNHFLYPLIDGHIDNILRPENIGLYRFKGIVFRRGDLLQGGGVNHVIDIAKGPIHSFLVPHVADKISDTVVFCIGKLLGHFKLLEFIPAVNDETPWFIFLENDFSAFFAERAGAASN